MGKLTTAVGIIYLVLSVIGIYVIIQTSANYTMVLETDVRFNIDLVNLTIENQTESPVLHMELIAHNPTSLDVQITYNDFTIYLYNKSAADPHEPVAVYSSYKLIKISHDETRLLTFNQNISNKKSTINYILTNSPNARIDFNIRFFYIIPQFPAWDQQEVQLATYQETSNYGT